MNFRKATTLDRLLPLLEGLGPWSKYAIWIGNGILDAYLTDEGSTAWRVPREASFLLQLPSMVERYQWETMLKDKGWQRIGLTDSGFVRYTWKSHSALISVFPGEALADVNRWYEDACFHAERIKLGENMHLRLFSPPYLVATTLELIPDIHGDLRYSEAFARLVFLFAGRKELEDELSHTYYEVRQFISSKLEALLSHPDLDEALIHVLPHEDWFMCELIRERMASLVSESVFSG